MPWLAIMIPVVVIGVAYVIWTHVASKRSEPEWLRRWKNQRK